MVLGVGLLFLINIIGTSYNIHLAINGYTAATASVLGIPGIAALIVIQKWII